MTCSRFKARSRKKSRISLERKSHLQQKPQSKSRRPPTLLPAISTCEPKISSMALHLVPGQRKTCSKPCNCSIKLSHGILCSSMRIVGLLERTIEFISSVLITPPRDLDCPKRPFNRFAVFDPNQEQPIWPWPSILTGRIRITTGRGRSWLWHGAPCLTNREFPLWPATSIGGKVAGRNPSRK